MKAASRFRVGDKLVRFSKLYTITDIKERKAGESKEPVLFFEPLFKNRRNETLVCSIPVSSIDKTNIRPPLTKEEVDELLQELSDSEVEEISFKRNSVEKKLNENVATDLVQIIKNLWIEKTDDERNFTVTKRSLFQSAVRQLSQEIAYVRDLSLDEASDLIIATLKKTGEYQHLA